MEHKCECRVNPSRQNASNAGGLAVEFMKQHMPFKKRCLVVLAALVALSTQAADAWKPGDGPLKTRWAADVSPENVLPEYPRPQMVRKDWVNLNGLWDYAVAPKAATSQI